MFNSGGQGHVACIDLLSDQVLWDHVIHPAVDRGDVTPDGKTLYVPIVRGTIQQPVRVRGGRDQRQCHFHDRNAGQNA